jgi:hypothetical protein
MVFCPCCGYDTLGKESDYEICWLCSWEDDPIARIDPSIETLHRLNLNQAKVNFKKYLQIFDPSFPNFVDNNTEEIMKNKREVIVLFELMNKETNEVERENIIQKIVLVEEKIDELYFKD